MHVERKQRRNCLSLSAVLIQTETFHVMSVRFYNCTFKIDNSKFSLICPYIGRDNPVRDKSFMFETHISAL